MRRIFLALGALLFATVTAILAPSLAAGAAEDASGGPSAGQLLGKLKSCRQISEGTYKPDSDEPAEIPVCATDDVVWWESDLDIDCDGKPTDNCNAGTDPWFQDDTAFHDAGDRPLVSDALPYIVVPSTSGIWDHTSAKIDGGTLVAVIYQDKVQYAVVGDTGPEDIIGEASYATATALGIDPDPENGGTDGPVHFVVFTGSEVSSWDENTIAEEGSALAREFAGQSPATTVKPTSGTNPPVTRPTTPSSTTRASTTGGSTTPSPLSPGSTTPGPASTRPTTTVTVTATVTATLIPPTVTVTATPSPSR